MFTAPCVVATVWLLSTLWLELESDDVVPSVAARLEAELLVVSTLCVEAEFRAEFVLLLLPLLDADALCDALFVLEELACCAARDALSLVVALLERAAFEDELRFEFAFSEALACCVALFVLALVAALLLAALLADALFAAFALLRAFPVLADELRLAESLADRFAASAEFCAEFAPVVLFDAELWSAA